MGELGLSYEAYCALTVAELLWMLEGYQRRWEEQWRHTRHLHTVLLNIHSTKKRFKASEVMKLPSEERAENEIITVDGKEITVGEWKARIKLKAEQAAERKKNGGAGISS